MKITFTSQKPEYIELEHPTPAKKHVPNWYKDMTRHIGPQRKLDVTAINGVVDKYLTLKACVPVQDFLTSGYIIPLWQELLVKKGSNGTLGFHWPDSNVEVITDHRREQVHGSPLAEETDGGLIFKFVSPWRIETPPGYSCLFFSPFYHRGDFEILPAIVDTDGLTEVNFPFIYKGPAGETLYSPGTPLIQVMPFKREDWTHAVEEGSDLQRKKVTTKFFQSFTKLYKSKYHKKKVFL
jgi:hypothetical protein